MKILASLGQNLCFAVFIIGCSDRDSEIEIMQQKPVQTKEQIPPIIDTEDQTATSVKIKFDIAPAKAIIVVDQPYSFKGIVTKGVLKVELLVDDWSLGEVAVDDSNSFNLIYQFSAAGQNRKLIARAFDLNDVQIAEYRYKINVLENPPTEDLSEYIANNDSFDLAEPTSSEIISSLKLWATYYTLHKATHKDDGIPMRNMNGTALGPKISTKDWCNSAMQGSAYIVDSEGVGAVYNYAGITNKYFVNCSSVFNHPNSGKVKFKLANGKFGDGVRNYALAPFRSIATDPKVIPYGTVVYIPKARGTIINFSTGQSIIHDGYFFAADTGGLIKQNHIDVFIGTIENNPFVSWVKSASNLTFKAYVIESDSITNHLEEMSKL